MVIHNVHVADPDRFEVIDHRHGQPLGRFFVAYRCKVELVYQDGGRTLKVFLTDRDDQ